MSTDYPHNGGTPDTSIDAYKRVLAKGDDVTKRRRVAAMIATESRTANELDSAADDMPWRTLTARINELVRMGCVERRGKRETPSGNEAYVLHITPTGEQYVLGEADPDMAPTTSELQRQVIDAARRYIRGDVSQDILHIALEKHDSGKRKMDPDWEPDVSIPDWEAEYTTDE